MSNSAIDDRRDVAHQTNPVGLHESIEQDRNLARPLDADAAKLPAAGSAAQISGAPNATTGGREQGDTLGGLSDHVPPARTGQSQDSRQGTQTDPDVARVDPSTRLPDLPTSDH